MANPNMGLWPEHTYSEEDFNPITQEQAMENPINGYRGMRLLSYYAPGY
jgi:hypothetical protein